MLERDDEQGLEWELGVCIVAEPIPVDVKRFVFERDRGRCLACGSEELIQYDHVVPSSMGGGNEPENLRLLCAGCNRRQRRRQELEARSLKHFARLLGASQPGRHRKSGPRARRCLCGS